MDIQYPGYSDIEQYISKNPKCFFEFAEYSDTSHECMKRIYNAFNSDNSDDVIKRAIKAIGAEIHARGGMDAMRGCFYMMVIAYRIMIKGTHTKVAREYQGQIHLLEKYWEGVGEWES